MCSWTVIQHPKITYCVISVTHLEHPSRHSTPFSGLQVAGDQLQGKSSVSDYRPVCFIRRNGVQCAVLIVGSRWFKYMCYILT